MSATGSSGGRGRNGMYWERCKAVRASRISEQQIRETKELKWKLALGSLLFCLVNTAMIIATTLEYTALVFLPAWLRLMVVFLSIGLCIRVLTLLAHRFIFRVYDRLKQLR